MIHATAAEMTADMMGELPKVRIAPAAACLPARRCIVPSGRTAARIGLRQPAERLISKLYRLARYT